jgi:hypothetical protein
MHCTDTETLLAQTSLRSTKRSIQAVTKVASQLDRPWSGRSGQVYPSHARIFLCREQTCSYSAHLGALSSWVYHMCTACERGTTVPRTPLCLAPARQESVTRELRRILIGTMVLNRELPQLSELPGPAREKQASKPRRSTTGGQLREPPWAAVAYPDCLSSA